MKHSSQKLHKAIAQSSLVIPGAVCWVCGISPPVLPEADHFVPLAKPLGPILPNCRSCNRNRQGVMPTGEQVKRLKTAKVVGNMSGAEAIAWAEAWAEQVYGSKLHWKIAVADIGSSRYIFREIDGIRVKCRHSTNIAISGRDKHNLSGIRGIR